MPSVQDSGTLSATGGGTEDTLSTITATGTYVLMVDTAAMQAGDTIELRAKTKILSGGTTRQLTIGSWTGVQGDPIKECIPVPSDQEAVFTLTQTAGTARSYPWKVMLI